MNEPKTNTTNDISARHRRWVANHLTGKVKELRYHLTVLVEACDSSLRLFAQGQRLPESNGPTVLYSFSAFVNVIQTLKDAITTVTGQQLPWSKIEQLRHGAFMRGVRNAATHDGHPIVSAWVDGHYYIPSKIVRLDQHGELIEIPAPRQDVLTLCLEFTIDFCRLLATTLADIQGAPELVASRFDITELDEALADNTVIPEFAKQLYAANRNQINATLHTIKHDPVKQAIDVLCEVSRYCESVRQT